MIFFNEVYNPIHKICMPTHSFFSLLLFPFTFCFPIVVSEFDYVFSENGLVAFKEGVPAESQVRKK